MSKFNNNGKPEWDEYQERCSDCFFLYEGDRGEWMCDENECDIHEIRICPEGLPLKSQRCPHSDKGFCSLSAEDKPCNGNLPEQFGCECNEKEEAYYEG